VHALSTHKELQGLTKEQLGERAKRRRIAGWESMKKTELVQALAPKPKQKESRRKTPASAVKELGKKAPPRTAAKPTKGKSSSKAPSGQAERVSAKAAQKVATVTGEQKGKSKRLTPTDKGSSAKPASPKKTAGAADGAKVAKQSKVAASPKGASAVKQVPSKKQAASKGGTQVAAKVPAKAGTKLPVKAATAASSVQKKPGAAPKKAAQPAALKASGKTVASGKTTGKSAGENAPAKAAPTQAKPTKAAKAVKGRATPPAVTPSEEVQRLQQMQEQRELRKDLAAAMPAEVGSAGDPDSLKDRVVLIVRDPYWLQATWDVTRRSVERAKVVMAEHWHKSRPVLRLLQLDDSGTTSSTESVVRDIEIHGGVRNWYIEVPNPPSAFRVQLGYLTSNGRFHELAVSNGVQTPPPGGQANIDDHWTDIAEDFERIYAQSGGYLPSESGSDLRYVFERQLKRSMGVSALTQFGAGAERSFRRSRGFYFELDAELLVFGSTLPDAQVTIDGRPVKLRSDGSFAERLPLPDRRQVLPATACSRDGVEQQTIVLAVERNTKVMEVLTKEAADDGS